MSDDDAPLEVTLTQSKDDVNKRLKAEKKHLQRQKKNAKKRKPKWKNKQTEKSKELDESQFDDDDFKDEPSAKKRKVQTVKWMDEKDLFHHVKKDDDDKNNQQQTKIDDTENNDNDNDLSEGGESEIDFDDVPQEVIDMFEKAVKESKTEKELEDKWKSIMKRVKGSKLKHKLSQFDKVFVDGFQIEVNGVYRLNVSALKRALRMKHFRSQSQHRIPFNKKMSYGSLEPSFAFIKGSVTKKYDVKNKKFQPTSFWGQKLEKMQKAVEKDQLQKWMDL